MQQLTYLGLDILLSRLHFFNGAYNIHINWLRYKSTVVKSVQGATMSHSRSYGEELQRSNGKQMRYSCHS